MFNERPSRSEDIEIIKNLKSELIIKEEEVRKAFESVKFYKLELINREQNYNKVFNANPNVGILNPLENKVNFLNQSIK